jgi:hypothetical protein
MRTKTLTLEMGSSVMNLSNMGVQVYYGKGLHRLLWGGPLAAHGKSKIKWYI